MLIGVMDFDSLGATDSAVRSTYEEDGTRDPGPYLFLANDQGAWIRRYVSRPNGYSALHTTMITPATAGQSLCWKRAVDLWVEDSDISRAQLIRRYKIMSRELRDCAPGTWVRWGEAYRWEGGSDLMWEGLEIHPHIQRRETSGVLEIAWRGGSRER